MSHTVSLTRSYCSFFVRCAEFAVSPYTKTFFSIAKTNNKHNDPFAHAPAAAIACGLLTFIVPVLPILTSITSSLASVAFVLALVSMAFSYPFALIADCCQVNPDDEFGFSAP